VRKRAAWRCALIVFVLSWAGLGPGSRPGFAQVSEAPAGPFAIHSMNASFGRYGIFRGREDFEIAAEIRYAPRHFSFLPSWLPEVSPVIGGMATRSGTFYGYLGFRTDVPMDGRWIFSPFWGAGYYSFGGGRDLGGELEFRSGFELAYELEEGERIGLTLYHLSNAGLYERNPGSESLVLSYTKEFLPRRPRD
jgi:lipid A 3-O-deacylase